MKDAGIDSQAFHISGSVPGQHRRWNGNADLVVELTTEFRIPNQSSIPFHDIVASIKIQRTDMEESVDLINPVFLPIETTTFPWDQSAIDQIDVANHSIVNVFDDSGDCIPP